MSDASGVDRGIELGFQRNFEFASKVGGVPVPQISFDELYPS